jgi:hypothetical protein
VVRGLALLVLYAPDSQEARKSEAHSDIEYWFEK